MVLFTPPVAAVMPPTLSNIWLMRYSCTNLVFFSFLSGFILGIVSVECRPQGLRIRQPALSSLVQLLHCVLLRFILRPPWVHLCGPSSPRISWYRQVETQKEGAETLNPQRKHKCCLDRPRCFITCFMKTCSLCFPAAFAFSRRVSALLPLF